MNTKSFNNNDIPHEFSEDSFFEFKNRIKTSLIEPSILGSQLGELIIKTAEKLNTKIMLKEQYGGLRKFTEHYLSDILSLKISHGPGQAERYEVLAIQSDKDMTLTATTKRFFWMAISKPLPKFVIENRNGELVCLSRKSDHETSDNQLPSLTTDEYRSIANGFAETLSEPVAKTSAFKILTTSTPDALHTSWIHFLSNECPPPIFAQWRQYRAAKLIELFKQKAATLGIDSEKISTYVAIINEKPSYSPPRPPQISSGKDNQQRISMNSVQTTTLDLSTKTTALQLATINIILKMTDDQLRLLSLPLGLCLDSTAHLSITK